MAKKIKHFIDIQVARLEDDEFKEKNTGAFKEGDLIQDKLARILGDLPCILCTLFECALRVQLP